MASGTIKMDVSSVDYPNYTRGAIQVRVVFDWNVTDAGVLSFTYQGIERVAGGNLWCVCSVRGYTVDVDFSTDGANWTNIMHSFGNNWQSCDTCYAGKANEVDSIARTLASQLGTYTLRQSGYIRMRMWTPVAAPTAAYPNAFPDDAASQATQVPIHIEVDWDAKLRYNANGGSNAPAGVTEKESGGSHTFTVSNQAPTRKHFIFHGWSRTQKVCHDQVWYTAADAEIHGGDQVTVTKDNPRLELYAVWEYTYRPGQIRQNGSWVDCDRDDSGGSSPLGHADIRRNGQWVEMRTRRNMVGTQYAPNIRRNNEWQSQDIGSGGACHDVTY